MANEGTQPTALLGAPGNPAGGDPLVGTLVGDRYRLTARLGEGGMGAVYRAEHVLMKKVVALKLLHPEMGQVEEVVRRFEREAQSASRLSHPSIVTVTDFGRAASGALFLVMEYLPGASLAQVLEREGALPVRRAASIVAQILRGLEHAHAQGVVHRDLKPANIMLAPHPDASGEGVKLLDFGIAKMSEAGGTGDPRLTRGSVVFGTPSYMSPEQATGQDADARTDLYSCGVMLYEALVGRKPFVSDDLVKVMAMHVTAAPLAPRVAAPAAGIPAALDAVVLRALEKDRSRRFQSAAEFRAALEGAAAGAGVPARLRAGGALLARGVDFARVHVRAALPANPAARRRAVGAIVALGAVLVALPLLCSRGGPAPTAPPPRPKAVEPELKGHLDRIETTIAGARLAEARLLILQQISAYPGNGRLRYLLGNIEFAEKNAEAGLATYAEALRVDPALRGDAALLVNVQKVVSDRRLGKQALDMMIDQIGKPAAAPLADIGTRDRRPEFRKGARDACGALGCLDEIDLVESYSLDLAQGRSCEDRREAVRNLGRTGDPRAIEPLRRARRAGGGITGFLGLGNTCIRRDIDAALKELEE